GDPTPTTPTLPKVEVKDGATYLDGKKVVPESDLIASKKSLEGQLAQQQTAHETAIDTAKLDVSNAQQEIANLNAKIKENEQARESGAVSDEDAAKVKQNLETAVSSIGTLTASALEHRRALLVLKYGVTEDTIKDKDISQLDSFEEALKAVSTARGGGVGPYAIGGGTGEAAPQTDIERAAKILETTPVRGVRNAAPQT
ncbi:hypothetical protein LCGC14_0872930, partial [marine sediment metagenome]